MYFLPSDGANSLRTLIHSIFQMVERGKSIFHKHLLVLLLLLSFSAAIGQTLPNIIYILVDDLGYGDVNLALPGLDRFNNPHVKTPHLAKLASRSKVFTHHYSASPVCSPSRAGLLTGRTPTRCNIGLYINDTRDNEKYLLTDGEVTIAEMLKTRGYQTAIFGKWHLNGADWEDTESWTGWTGSFPKQQGFDQGFVSKENPHFTRKLKVNTQKHPGDFFSVDGQPLGPVKGYTSDIVTQWAVDYLKEQQPGSAPFFLYLAYDAVHIRVSAADKYVDAYDTGNARKDAYYANITHLDAAIGRLLDSLEVLGLNEETMIFFSSDNGPDVLGNWDATYFCYGTSYPLMGQKYQLYEGGIRVPGMVSWPGHIKPGVSSEPNSTLDVLPTLATLTGARIPSDRAIDGESLLEHLLNDASISRKQAFYWQFDLHRPYLHQEGERYERHIVGPERSEEKLLPRVKLRWGDHTLYGFSDEAFAVPTQFKMYDLDGDPHEQHDVAVKFPVLFRDLKSRMLDKYSSVEQDRLETQQWIMKQGME